MSTQTRTLGWDDLHDIARALQREHEDVDRLTLDDDQLCAMITGLPEFSGTPRPENPDRLRHIRLAWIAQTEPADEDGRYDYFQ